MCAGGKAYPPDYALVFPLELQNLRDMIYEIDWQPGWATLLPIAMQLASALAQLHKQDILHRCVWPRSVAMAILRAGAFRLPAWHHAQIFDLRSS